MLPKQKHITGNYLSVNGFERWARIKANKCDEYID